MSVKAISLEHIRTSTEWCPCGNIHVTVNLTLLTNQAMELAKVKFCMKIDYERPIKWYWMICC
jgi:hypothetical protein